MKRFCIILYVWGILLSAASAREIQWKVVADSLKTELSQAKTSSDSMLLMLHLIDMQYLPLKEHLGILYQIVDVAHRMGDVERQLEAWRHICNASTENDSIMAICEQKVRELPASNEQKEAIAFIQIDRISLRAMGSTAEERSKIVQQLINNYDKLLTDDLFERIVRTYEICIYLSYATTGDLYTQYLEMVGKLIDQLPPDARHALPTMYYTQSANIYTRGGNHKKAIETDRQQMVMVREAEKRYWREGRIFKNYTNYYYTIYRRILFNFPGLTPEEVEDCYQHIMELVSQKDQVREDYKNNTRTEASYRMARKEYAKALPLLKKAIVLKSNRRYLYTLVRFTLEAAEAVGDKESLLEASTQYIKLMDDYNQSKSAEKYRELQILYDVNSLRAEADRLELEKRESQARTSRIIITSTAFTILILVVLLLVVVRLYYKSRKLAESLKESQKALLKEQEELAIARDQAESANRMKTLFIQNMSHEIRTPLNAIVGFSQVIIESVPPEMKADMDEFGQMVSRNCTLLLTLVGDVLDIAQMESGEMKVNIQPCSLQTVCNLVVSNVKPRVDPGVEMVFRQNPGDPEDFTLNTDAARLEQVLINFLTNASKYTHEGEIVLAFSIDAIQRQVIFSVTDTGVGIPADKAEVIFERFEKLNSFVQGTGLGLHICRLIANMLHGVVKVDTSYTDGARFLFIHPIDQSRAVASSKTSK